jgi:hypothetical protein
MIVAFRSIDGDSPEQVSGPMKRESATSLGDFGLVGQIVEVVEIQLFSFALERSRLGWVPFW